MKYSMKICMAIFTSLALALASPSMAALAVGQNPECLHVVGVPHSTLYHIRTVDHGDGTYTFWYRCQICGCEISEDRP